VLLPLWVRGDPARKPDIQGVFTRNHLEKNSTGEW
jgi:hypothetical protein